ncbi:hypothetical protein FEM48_Zijuj01G0280400 [Ziziphus jujuba var. spinosa]|uniref:Uncharacterized protein n=1 Tax=Ziziphus jujuba var. spinosa TaxID=714518 RepID=A0A978W5D0_ZIZJJ|nr:hypothetical protein FEM48_Zijuj01G0280400 [Ziziphus jujuba var. spinosa]
MNFGSDAVSEVVEGTMMPLKVSRISLESMTGRLLKYILNKRNELGFDFAAIAIAIAWLMPKLSFSIPKAPRIRKLNSKSINKFRISVSLCMKKKFRRVRAWRNGNGKVVRTERPHSSESTGNSIADSLSALLVQAVAMVEKTKGLGSHWVRMMSLEEPLGMSSCYDPWLCKPHTLEHMIFYVRLAHRTPFSLQVWVCQTSFCLQRDGLCHLPFVARMIHQLEIDELFLTDDIYLQMKSMKDMYSDDMNDMSQKIAVKLLQFCCNNEAELHLKLTTEFCVFFIRGSINTEKYEEFTAVKFQSGFKTRKFTKLNGSGCLRIYATKSWSETTKGTAKVAVAAAQTTISTATDAGNAEEATASSMAEANEAIATAIAASSLLSFFFL